jgi:thymidylate synthase (FAD)
MKFVEQSADIMPLYDDPIKHIERCGRIAYKSEDKITEDSANKFVRMIVKRGHLSVIEHANVNFWVEKYNLSQLKDYTLNQDTKFLYINPRTNIVSGNYRAFLELIAQYPIKFIDLFAKLNEIAPIIFEDSYQQLPYYIRKNATLNSFIIATNNDIKYQDKPYTTYHSVHFITSRGISHELVRHRLVAITQESTRYCNYKNQDIQFIKQDFDNRFQEDTYEASCSFSELNYKNMIQHGAPPQIARDVLNHGLKTELILTANLAEWHHILKLRCSKQAHPQMQALMKPLLFQFKTIYPDYFDDLKSYQE